MKQNQQTPQGNKLKSESRKRPSVATMALVNAIMLTGAAQAQTNTPPVTAGISTNAPTKLPDVVITGEKVKDETSYQPQALQTPKLTEPLVNTAQTITVIPRSVMEDQGATSLRDVLRNVPGISIQAGEGGVPAGDNLSIRGFNARTDMFVDGVRDFGGYSRDPFNMEQVEVFKGPASSTSGRGSTGGSINMVTKAPQLDPFYSGSTGVGTDAYFRQTIDINQPLKNTGFEGTSIRLNGLWHQNDTPGRDEVSNERWGVAPSLAFGLGTPTRLTLSYFHLQQDNMPDYGIPFVPVGNANPILAQYGDQVAPVDYSNFYGNINRDYEKIQTDLGTAILEHDFNDSYSLRNLFRMGMTSRDSVITAPRFAAGGTGLVVNRQFQSRDQVDTVLANQTDFTSRFETGQVDHTLVTGLELAVESSENYARTAPAAPPTDIFNPNPDDPFAGPITRTGAVNKADAMTVSLYAFDTMKLGEQWQLNGGLRFDHFVVKYRQTAVGGAVTPFDNYDDTISWRSSLVYKPRANGSVYFGYGTSFNPSAEGLTLGAGAGNSANVDAEKNQTFELGTKWNFFHERLSVSSAIFRTDKTNARTTDPVTGDIVIDGEQYVQGFELGAAGRITDDWQVFAGYTYMVSEITASGTATDVGNELPNTPEQSFNLWTTYQLPWGIELGGGAQFVDTRYSSNANTRQVEGYVLYDMMIGYRINKNFDVRLNIYNLADSTYIDRVGGGHVIPGAGRSAVLTASFKF